jgi:hypothetical protein
MYRVSTAAYLAIVCVTISIPSIVASRYCLSLTATCSRNRTAAQGRLAAPELHGNISCGFEMIYPPNNLRKHITQNYLFPTDSHLPSLRGQCFLLSNGLLQHGIDYTTISYVDVCNAPSCLGIEPCVRSVPEGMWWMLYRCLRRPEAALLSYWLD